MARFMTGTKGGTAQTHVWLTPRWILDALGPFDLDPCAAPEPRPWPTATKMITLPEDGFAALWHDRVWLNPPYGKHVARWVGKLADHGRGMALLFGRHETVWFQNSVLQRATAILFIKGRISFCLPDGTTPKREGGNADAGAPSVLVAYGDDDAYLLEASGIPGTWVFTGNARRIVTNQVEMEF